MKENTSMTDYQLKYYNRLHKFIRKLLRLLSPELREDLEKEYDEILDSDNDK
ncbi:MAG: hypothetical protein ACI4JB_06480 [Porcipelethomonas sp.]